jgi:hypothetical protein
MRLSTVQRLGATVLAVLLLVPLGVASRLQPNRRGYGTHQQLGLPPCSASVLLGVRCPMCGGTTAWANLVRGRGREALAANSGATLLGVLCLVAIPWLLWSALRGRWCLWAPNGTTLAWVAVALTAVTLIDWLVRLRWG